MIVTPFDRVAPFDRIRVPKSHAFRPMDGRHRGGADVSVWSRRPPRPRRRRPGRTPPRSTPHGPRSRRERPRVAGVARDRARLHARFPLCRNRSCNQETDVDDPVQARRRRPVDLIPEREAGVGRSRFVLENFDAGENFDAFEPEAVADGGAPPRLDGRASRSIGGPGLPAAENPECDKSDTPGIDWSVVPGGLAGRSAGASAGVGRHAGHRRILGSSLGSAYIGGQPCSIASGRSS
ncbi:hypothetical protein JJ691_70600 [Kutzneria sp. CA-103260]|nr:hypothetical protein JJ691_70600 [Kutzneria sp. CA-103260]